MRQESGFTMVELLVSVSIFAVLTTVGLLTFQRNQATQQIRDSSNLLVSSTKKIQGFTRAGRGVNHFSTGVFTIPRAYGLSFDALINPTSYATYADHSAGEYYCLYCPNVSDDTLIERVEFANNVIISQIELFGGDPIVPPPTRVDIVFTLPNAEVKIVYKDPVLEDVYTEYLPTTADGYVTLMVTLVHQRTGATEKIEIWGGPLGGVVNNPSSYFRVPRLLSESLALIDRRSQFYRLMDI